MCTGAKTEAMARLAARKYARIIQKLGFPAQFKARTWELLERACSTRVLTPALLRHRTLRSRTSLRPATSSSPSGWRALPSHTRPLPTCVRARPGSLCVMLCSNVACLSYRSPCPPQYEPELFPGLIYRMRSPKIVLLIFVSGKVVLTGGKARVALCCLRVCLRAFMSVLCVHVISTRASAEA